MRDLTILEKSVLEIPANAPFDHLLDLQNSVAFAKQMIKEIDKLVDDRMYEFLVASGPQRIGEILWCVSPDKDHKVKHKPPVMAQKMMELTGGDWDKFGGLLASSAFKQGAVHSVCEEMAGSEEAGNKLFAEFFDTIPKKAVVGRPAGNVKQINTNFI